MSEDICRYCLDLNNENSVIPCNCTSPVHEICLIEWINKRQINRFDNFEEFKRRLITCEICNKQFQLSHNIENRINQNRITESRNNHTTLKCYYFLPYLFLGLFLFFLFLLTGEIHQYSNSYNSYINNSTNITLQEFEQEFDTVRFLTR